MAERMDDRVDRRESVDNSDVYVFRDRAETFLLGGRSACGDEEYAEPGLLVRTFRFLGDNCDDLISGVSALEPGILVLMNP